MLLAKGMSGTYVLRKVWRDLFSVLVIATLIEVILHFNRSYLPALPETVPAFLGTAISLILSFRMSQSYSRWWEARTLWGNITADSRTLARQLLSFAGSDPKRVHDICHRQIAWGYCLGQRLRGLAWRSMVSGVLSERDGELLSEHDNPAVGMLHMQAMGVAALAEEGHLTEQQLLSVDNTLTRLTTSMSGVEKIDATPFPRTYRLTMYGFIYLFIVALSIVLHDIEGVLQILVTVLISTPFFLLERTARHMQTPFADRPTDAPVTSIARDIEIDLRQMLGEDEIPERHEPQGFYLM